METFSALLALCAGNSPSPVNSPHKGQWRGALMFSLIRAWIHGWVNTCEAGDLRRHRGHYDVNVMFYVMWILVTWYILFQNTFIYHIYIYIIPRCFVLHKCILLSTNRRQMTPVWSQSSTCSTCIYIYILYIYIYIYTYICVCVNKSIRLNIAFHSVFEWVWVRSLVLSHWRH